MDTPFTTFDDAMAQLYTGLSALDAVVSLAERELPATLADDGQHALTQLLRCVLAPLRLAYEGLLEYDVQRDQHKEHHYVA